MSNFNTAVPSTSANSLDTRLLDLRCFPPYFCGMHFHLVFVSCGGAHLSCNRSSFPNIRRLQGYSAFQSNPSPILLLLAIQSSPFFAIVCCTFVGAPRLSASTQPAIRSWVFCRCFADQSWFCSLLLYSNCAPTRHLRLCVQCLAICLCSSPNPPAWASVCCRIVFAPL